MCGCRQSALGRDSPRRFGQSPRDAIQKDLNQRAESYGFTYRPAADIAETAEFSEFIDRLTAVVPSETPLTPKVQRDTDAFLGITVSCFCCVAEESSGPACARNSAAPAAPPNAFPDR